MMDHSRHFASAFSIALILLVASACQNTASTSFTGERSTTTGYNPAYDFVPSSNLQRGFPAVTKLVPLADYAVDLETRISEADAERICNWVSQESFPKPQGGLVGFGSFREFQTTGRHRPNDANRWFEDLAFYSKRAAANIVGDPQSPTRSILARALAEHAKAGSALDVSKLVDPELGRPVAVPDTALAALATTALTVSYLLTEDKLVLAGADREDIETWLNQLNELYVNGYRAWHGNFDLRSEWLLGHADMAWGLLTKDKDRFNRGAQGVLKFASHTRADGSHRFGASRGYRALYYQGVSLNSVTDSLVLFESQGLPARDILLPTANRLASFFSRAWEDHSVLWPYAQENEGTPPGSDYRTQDRVSVPAGLDIMIAISSDQPLVGRLREIRAEHPYGTNYSDTFNTTCVAAGLERTAN